MAASYDAGNGKVAVMFNRELLNQPLTESNWVLNIDGGIENPTTSPSVDAPDSIALEFATGLVDVLSIEYFATPPDVMGLPPGSLATPAFVFPVTTI